MLYSETLMRMYWRCLSILGAGVLLFCIVPSEGRAQSPRKELSRLSSGSFIDVAEQSGLSAGLSAMSIAWLHWNQDGWPDLWLGHHGDKMPGKLFLNQQDGTFSSDIAPQITSPYSRTWDQHGALWADLDNDGDQDLIVETGAASGKGAEPNLIFRNESSGTSLYGSLVLQEGTGLEYERGRGRMPAAVDYDGDGLIDIIPTTTLRPGGTLLERAPARLFRQTSTTVGTFSFADMSVESGFQVDKSVDFGQIADLSGDQRPDILLVHGGAFPVRIYDPTTTPFTDLTSELMPRNFFRVRDATIADFNGDLHADLFLCRRYWASDWAQSGDSLFTMELRVQKNSGSRLPYGGATVHTSGSLRIRGVDVPVDHIYVGSEGHHPSSSLDIVLDHPNQDNYGLVDPDTLDQSGQVFIAGYDTTEATWTVKLVALSGGTNRTLAVSTPESTIENFSPIGAVEESHSSVLLLYDPEQGRYVRKTSGNPGRFSCTNTTSGDFDNDGDIDLYLANVGTLRSRPNALLENDGRGNFHEVPGGGGAAGDTSAVFGGNVLEVKARTITADYDRDGFLDLFTPGSDIVKILGDPILDDNGGPVFKPIPTQLFRNRGASLLPADEHHYAFFDLVGTLSNRDAIGARIVVYAGGKSQLREQGGGVRHFAQDDKLLHVGLGASTRIDSVIVQWPNGNAQYLTDLSVDQVHTIVENAPPTARDDVAEARSGKPVQVNVLKNDSDADDGVLSIRTIKNPLHGTASKTKSTITYTPDEWFAGQDTLEYTIQDGQGGRSQAQVIVSVSDPPPIERDLRITAEWNLVGVPLAVEDSSYQALFADLPITSSPVAFQGSYVEASRLVRGKGYWIEAESSKTKAVGGQAINTIQLDLSEGWNLISGPSCSLPAEAIVDSERSINPGTLHAYRRGGYTPSDTLHPGAGYWLHARSDGAITLDCNAISSSAQATHRNRGGAHDDRGRLVISSSASRQQVLYFGAKQEESSPVSSEMPPAPPANAFDARFEGGRRVIESEDGFIELQVPSYPVTIELAAQPQKASSQTYVLEELVHNEVVAQHNLRRGRPVSIENASVKRLRLQAEADRPDAFTLRGNYPNPVQTTTTIAMDLPESAKVSVAVFDILGRHVMTLPEQVLYAGSGRTLPLDATQLASGMYIYRLRAEMTSRTVTKTGRMIVAK